MAPHRSAFRRSPRRQELVMNARADTPGADLFQNRNGLGASGRGERTTRLEAAPWGQLHRIGDRTADRAWRRCRVVKLYGRVDEPARVGVAWVVDQLLGRAALDDAPCVHDRHVRAEIAHNSEVVAHEHDGQAEPPAQAVEQLEYLCLNSDVERSRRLVA